MEETITNTDSASSKKYNPMIIVVIIVLVALIGAAVMMANKKTNGDSMSAEEISPTPSQTVAETGTMANTTTPATSPAMTNEVVINMEAGAYYYNPKIMTVKKGQKVKINFKAKDMMHNINIDELNVKGPTTKGGDTATVEFTADKVGSFEYYCSVGQHRKLGQVGTITVTE